MYPASPPGAPAVPQVPQGPGQGRGPGQGHGPEGQGRQLPPGVLTIHQSERVTTIQCVGYHPNISFDISMSGVSIVIDMPHEALQPTYMTADRFLMRLVQVPEVVWYNGYYVWRYDWLHF